MKLNLDGTGKADIATGVGFLDHMLTLLAVHSFMDLTVRAKGDLEVDCHHTVEDGHRPGAAIARGSGGTRRASTGTAVSCCPWMKPWRKSPWTFPVSPYLVWNADIIPRMTLGNFDTEMGEDFFGPWP